MVRKIIYSPDDVLLDYGVFGMNISLYCGIEYDGYDDSGGLPPSFYNFKSGDTVKLCAKDITNDMDDISFDMIPFDCNFSVGATLHTVDANGDIDVVIKQEYLEFYKKKNIVVEKLTNESTLTQRVIRAENVVNKLDMEVERLHNVLELKGAPLVSKDLSSLVDCVDTYMNFFPNCIKIELVNKSTTTASSVSENMTISNFISPIKLESNLLKSKVHKLGTFDIPSNGYNLNVILISSNRAMSMKVYVNGIDILDMHNVTAYNRNIYVNRNDVIRFEYNITNNTAP